MLDRILKRTINGGEYTITPLASRAGGLEVYRKLHRHLAPAMGSFARLIGEGEKLESVGPEIASSLVLHLGSALGDPEFCQIVDRMFAACAFNGGPIGPDHWDTRLTDHDELLGYCLWVNFLRPFAEPLLRRLGTDPDKLLQAWNSRRISTPSTLAS